MTVTPIRIQVVRWKCPACSKSYANKSATTAHIGRCWYNPAARSCKTCDHFIGRMGDDVCTQGVDLTGRPGCERCGGFGTNGGDGGGGVSECHDCGGEGAEIKPGPITGCAEWEPGEGYEDATP